jgi:glycosyltransferase involved in cell wall biosynthesis
MKIIYLHQYFNTPSDAGGTRSYEMARRLVYYGHEVHMITSYREDNRNDGGNWFETTESGIKVYWLSVPYANQMSYGQRINAFVKFAWGAAIRAASLEADLVFATSTPLTIALPAVYSARKLKVPMVFEVRDLWPELPLAIGAIKNPLLAWFAKRLELFAYKNAKRVIALSPGIKEGIIITGYPENSVAVIPNGCDIELFRKGRRASERIRKEYGWLQDRPLILYAGTVGLINGVEYLAILAKEIIDIAPDIRFVVIGEGKGLDKLYAEAERAGVLNENLYLLPQMPKSDMPGWFGAADIVTSLFIDLKEMWNNSANKFFDALAAGKPIAINYGGWQAELLTEVSAGVVLDPKDMKQSAKLLVKRIEDNKWLEEAGVASAKLASERFNRNDLARKLEKVLVEAVEESFCKH